ncbi:MAG: hypothetical protein GY810_27940 [Aureispira sp.]|nr:hypothetical protein [Aureispira sp.]
MNWNTIILTLAILLSFGVLSAQELNNTATVQMRFEKEPLGDVLNQIKQQYGVQFSYGNDHINPNQSISFESEGKTLEATLQQLFKENNLAYMKVGNQFMLKPGIQETVGQTDSKTYRRQKRQQQRKERIEQRDLKHQETLERKTLFDTDLYSEISNNMVGSLGPMEGAAIEPAQDFRADLATNNIDPLTANTVRQISTDSVEPEEEDYIPEAPQKTLVKNIAQFSVVPMLGTTGGDFDRSHNFSFNLFWGINGGVNGFEIGGLGNTIKRHVNGFQVAGLFNTVGGNVKGMQVGGLFNTTKGVVSGAQMASFWNIGKTVSGAQVAGITNISKNLNGFQVAGLCNFGADVKGLQVAGLCNFANGQLWGGQIAGLGNIAWGGKYAIQVAGLFNKSAKAQFQVAGIFNTAQEVQGFQMSTINKAHNLKGLQFGVINTAKEVYGAQIGVINTSKRTRGVMIGLINVTDSLQGFPIGLINIVRKNGYNRFEIAASDAMYVNTSLKFGPKFMYHIVQAGWSMNNSNEHSWAIGLGLGARIPINDRFHLNTEIISSHVNEGEFFTTRLNLLNQFKLTLDIKISKKISFFFGPTYNAMVSQKYNETTQTYGSNIMPYTFFDQTSSNTNLKMWVGGTAGFRF